MMTIEYPHVAFDEAGRGALAGRLTVCGLILGPEVHIPGLRESKQLRPHRVVALAEEILRLATAVSVGFAEVDEINKYGLEGAQRLAYGRAFGGLALAGHLPHTLVIDGKINYLEGDPNVLNGHYVVTTVVGGDALYESIAAASVIAKRAFDDHMRAAATDNPRIGYGQHFGYATPQHLQALGESGPSTMHRKRFGPVAALSAGQYSLWEQEGVAPPVTQMDMWDTLTAEAASEPGPSPARIAQYSLWKPADFVDLAQGELWPIAKTDTLPDDQSQQD